MSRSKQVKENAHKRINERQVYYLMSWRSKRLLKIVRGTRQGVDEGEEMNRVSK